MRPSTLAVGCLLSIAPILGGAAVAGARQATPAIVGPAFFAVQVEDVEAMAAWYGRVFGLEVVNRLDAEDGRYAIRILSGGGLAVELIQRLGTTRPAGTPQGHFRPAST